VIGICVSFVSQRLMRVTLRFKLTTRAFDRLDNRLAALMLVNVRQRDSAYFFVHPGDAPTGRAFLQGKSKHRAGLLDQLPLLLERVVRGNDDIGTVCRDIDAPGVAEGDDPIGDPILLGVGVEVIRPIRGSPRTVPCVLAPF
jgi:hypothetical protein